MSFAHSEKPLCFTRHIKNNHSLLEVVPFNFDLERMKKAVEAPMHRVPTNLSTKEFIEWMKRKKHRINR